PYGSITNPLSNPVTIKYDERLLQGVVTPLHASKRANEIYAQCYIDTFKLKVACFRLTGIYGPNQFGGEDHGWVANFSIRNVLGLPLTIFGKGKQLRDVLYAADVARVFHKFYENQKPGIYNVGGGEKTMISLIECIRLIEKISGKQSNIKFDKDRFGDLRYCVLDISRVKKELDWEPEILPEEGVGKLINWINKNENLFIKNNPA
ncbi:MAG: NAD-dependent epimerase/dehydratase family protein, partial [Nanoarchaeota archaeon]